MNSTAMQTIPDSFDKNLVYVVNCKFSEAFLNSARNFDNNQQIFDVLHGFFYAVPYSSYLVHANFPLKSEFMKMVSSLQETGIMDFWTEHFIKTQFLKYSEVDKTVVTLNALQLPFLILIVGNSLSIIVFIFELIYQKYTSWKSSRVIDLRARRHRRFFHNR
jgi:hypothetical protein